MKENIILSQKQKEVLKRYNVDTATFNRLLSTLDTEIGKRFDMKEDTLTDEGQMLQDLFDEIYNQNNYNDFIDNNNEGEWHEIKGKITILIK